MCGENLKHPAVELENREVKGSATKIINGHLGPVFELVQAVGEGSCGRFRKNPFHGEACQFPCPFGCGALGIIEVGWNRDDGTGDGLAVPRLGDGFEFF